MSETYGTTGAQNDDTSRELGGVEVSPVSGGTTGSATTGTGSTTGTGITGTTGSGTTGTTTGASTSSGGTGTGGLAGGAAGGTAGMSTTGISTTGESSTGESRTGDTKEVAKQEVRATGEQAKEGARHVAEVGRQEAKNVARETTQQAKELWRTTRSELLDQSAQQQSRIAEGLRSLSQELSSMARGSQQQGMASDLAQQASQRMGDVAGWLDQRDPGSLVSELKQFARRRPGAFLASAAALGVIGGRLSRGLVADHQDQSSNDSSSAGLGATPSAVDHSTSGYSAYGSPSGTATAGGDHPVTDTMGEAAGVHGGTGPISGAGTGAGEYPR